MKVSAKWIVIKCIGSIRDSPHVKISPMKERFRKEHSMHMSIDKCFKAKKIAMEIIRGKEGE